jgi:hypothetical protein
MATCHRRQRNQVAVVHRVHWEVQRHRLYTVQTRTTDHVGLRLPVPDVPSGEIREKRVTGIVSRFRVWRTVLFIGDLSGAWRRRPRMECQSGRHDVGLP